MDGCFLLVTELVAIGCIVFQTFWQGRNYLPNRRVNMWCWSRMEDQATYCHASVQPGTRHSIAVTTHE